MSSRSNRPGCGTYKAYDQGQDGTGTKTVKRPGYPGGFGKHPAQERTQDQPSPQYDNGSRPEQFKTIDSLVGFAHITPGQVTQ